MSANKAKATFIFIVVIAFNNGFFFTAEQRHPEQRYWRETTRKHKLLPYFENIICERLSLWDY